MTIPKHVAIIMDGNGRWAQEKGLPRTAGHQKGAQRIKEVVKESQNLGIKALTIFAFSTENWSRPKKEVSFLFGYLEKFIDGYIKEFMQAGVKLRMIGRRDRIDARVIKKIEEGEEVTKDNKNLVFNVALDYGGRWDIVNALERIALDCKNEKIKESDINENLISSYLSLSGIDDPELLIRTSGEKRISNFLIWNLAYTEFYFTPVFWPDFDKKQLLKAVKEYSGRSRRFGGINE